METEICSLFMSRASLFLHSDRVLGTTLDCLLPSYTYLGQLNQNDGHIKTEEERKRKGKESKA